MDTTTVEDIAIGVPFPCTVCSKGRIVQIETAGRDYKVRCQCGTKYFVTTTGRVFRTGGHK